MYNNYNTSAKRLPLPEYGRHIQNMVDYCKEIKDRDERQRCAEKIVRTMRAFFPKENEREDYYQVLWDHIFIMSNFELDVDFPYEVTRAEEFVKRQHCALDTHIIKQPRYLHYGHVIENMIRLVVEMPKGEERSELERITASQMKRAYIAWNKDNVANERIFQDLFEMSEGKIYLDDYTCVLPDAKDLMGNTQIPQNTGKKKKTNKRKRR